MVSFRDNTSGVLAKHPGAGDEPGGLHALPQARRGRSSRQGATTAPSAATGPTAAILPGRRRVPGPRGPARDARRADQVGER